LVVVASIQKDHFGDRRGGGFLNNSRWLGVSRKLSVKGNPVSWGLPRVRLRARPRGIPRDAKESRAKVHGFAPRTVGDICAVPEAGDATGIRERDFPSLLTALASLISMHCAEHQENCAGRARRYSACSRSPSVALEKPVAGCFMAMCAAPTVPTPHPVPKLSSLWRIE